MGNETHGTGSWVATTFVNADNLWNYLATLFHVHPIALMKVERTDEVLVVQSGTAHPGACQLHRLHIRHGSNRTRPAHLVRHFQKTGARTLRLVFVGYSPAW